MSKDLLSTSQRNIFADMVRDIVRQLKLNPNQIPTPTTFHRRTGSALEKVCFSPFFLMKYFHYLFIHESIIKFVLPLCYWILNVVFDLFLCIVGNAHFFFQFVNR